MFTKICLLNADGLIFYVYVDLRYELAEECADDDDEKDAITQLRKDVLEELKMHDSFALVSPVDDSVCIF